MRTIFDGWFPMADFWVRRLPLSLFLVVGGTLFARAAEPYTFDSVPPPSKYSGDLLSPERLASVPPQSSVVTNPPATAPPTPIITHVAPPGLDSTSPVTIITDAAPAAVVVSAPASTDSAPPVAAPELAPLPGNHSKSKLIVEPGGGIEGKVELVDAQGRFAVLNFPLGQMPNSGTSLNIYRHGVKAGEVTITGPQRDDNTVADVVSGDLKVGDSVRNR